MVKKEYPVVDQEDKGPNRSYDLIDVEEELREFGHLHPTKIQRRLYRKLKECGRWGQYDYYCRGCESSGRAGHLKTTYSQMFCEVRYCWNPDCVVERFARTLEDFKAIERLEDLQKLWHFVIGFPLVSMDDFKNNFSQIKKSFEKVMTSLWASLKRRGIVIPAIRVLDFSFEDDGGKVFVHFHFGAIPPKAGEGRALMKAINEIHDKMIKRLPDHQHFYFKSFKTKKKGAIFSYLAKRSAGIYKHGEGKNLKWNSGKGRLKKDLLAGKYFGLQDFLTRDDYINHFYNKRHYVTVGGLPRGSNLTDNSLKDVPTFCPHCQMSLERKDIRVDITPNVTPPPNFLKK
jgi:hypothetical protein